MFKSHCFKNQGASDDSLWKLLDISVVASPVAPDALSKSLSGSSGVEKTSESFVEPQFEPIVIATSRKRLSVSPPSVRPSITLFGKTRLGLLDSVLDREEKETISKSSDHHSSESYDANLRKFYRSMNMLVPRFLPSLVELIKLNKCARGGCNLH
ncbi:unnamed protein product [Fraxinus pennsylvanica]|uniref:Uncharacterized protein n=1 Tax=Fraxinus pennsylvanica TaxID=56036 RepID=A0AAD1ZX99_9LAMI|nr:unnamed protein product [Fraxinus pennsylvanica]